MFNTDTDKVRAVDVTCLIHLKKKKIKIQIQEGKQKERGVKNEISRFSPASTLRDRHPPAPQIL